MKFVLQQSYDGDDEYMPYQPPQYGASYTGAQPHYGPDSAADQAQGFADDQKPKILLMGLRRQVNYQKFI